jgi:NAD(P)-dependent dehydrogenase (short-subunit alcohol dehydrogenase family)
MSAAWHMLQSSHHRTSQTRSGDRNLVLYAAATALAVGSLWLQQRQRNQQEAVQRRSRQQRPKKITVRDVQGNASAMASDIVHELYKNVAKGKVYVVTGATSGLGRFTAVLLGKAGAHVILGVRNLQQGETVRQEIMNHHGSGTATVIHLDLASLQSTRQFCLEVKDLLTKRNAIKNSKTQQQLSSSAVLHGIVNNAGVYGVKGVTAENNIQTTWQVNALAPALLTELLLPVLDRDNGRVIHVSSEMYRALFWRKVSDHCPPPASSDGGATTFDYALSKASQIVHAHGLNRTFAAEKASTSSSVQQQQQQQRRRAFAIEPGLVQTNIGRHKGKIASFFNYSILGPFLLRTMDQGCASIVFCLLAPEEDLMGQDYNDDDEEHHHSSGDCDYYYYANCAPKAVSSNTVASVEEVTAQAQLFDQLLSKYKK